MSTDTATLPRPPRGSSNTANPRFHASRGPRRGGIGGAFRGANNKSQPESSDWAAEDPSSGDASEEVAQLKIKYANQLRTLKEVFPDWTAEDLVFALQEVDGDLPMATDRIAGGHTSQWGQVRKKSVKDKTKVASRPDGQVTATRGRGRGGSERGVDRAGRGRGEGRGRGRGRGEARGRGRGAAPGSVDVASTSATVASDETPTAWPDTNADEAITDTEPKDEGINGTTQDEPAPAFSWGAEPITTTAPSTETPSTFNGTSAKTPPVTSTAASRQSRIVDPTAKFSWASIVKPVVPPPAPKPAPQQKPAPPTHVPAPQVASRPSTSGQDVNEEPAQTIHDPFSTEAVSNKPKVQLPQPALPHIPIQPKTQAPPEPLTSRNLDLLEDQQPTAVPDPAPSVAAHRASPAPKSDGPPGLPRFPRNRDTPVVMPGIGSQSVGGMQLQFGSIDLNQETDLKAEETKEENLHPPQELETPQQPTPNQQRASPAVQPQLTPVQAQAQRIPTGPAQSQVPPAYQQPAAFGGLIPGQAQRFSAPAPAPGLTQSKEFGGFPYDQQYQGQTGTGYGDYLYGAGAQGQFDGGRDYYGYYQQQRAPPSTTDSQRPTAQSTTPSNTETPSQFGASTPASTAGASTQPTPTPSVHSQHQPHHPQYPGMHPYWTNPYYANQMYQQHYGGYPYAYNQGHKGMYQGQGYGGSGYTGQQGGFDRFSARDQTGGYDAFRNYSGNNTQTQSTAMQQHSSQQGQQSTEEPTVPTDPTPSQASQHSSYQGSSRPYGLGQSSSSGYQHHYPPQQQPASQQHYGYNPAYNTQGVAPPTAPQQSQGQNTNQPQRTQQQGGWGQQYGNH